MTAHLVNTQAPPTGGWAQYGRMWRRRFPGGLIGRVYHVGDQWLWSLWKDGDTEIQHAQYAPGWETAAAACRMYAFAYHEHHREIVKIGGDSNG